MKLIVTGSGGQLGREFVRLLSDKNEVYGFGKKDLDITNRTQVRQVTKEIKPDFIINCAAMTDVDICETFFEEAFKVNSEGPLNLAEAARDYNAILVHFSSSFVFSGEKRVPYTEDDIPKPINFYGKSKLLGEKEIERTLERYYIIRTSWLYSREGNNFVNSLIEMSKKNKHFVVVEDEIGSPTYTKDVVLATESIIKSGRFGLYHCSNKGVCSRYQFAEKIFVESGVNVMVMPSNAEEFKTRARRPVYTPLETNKLEKELNYYMRNYEEALKDRFRG